MKVVFAEKFIRQYRAAPFRKQALFDKHLTLLLKDLRHPSLRAKEYNGALRIWQARLDSSWRFYFQIKTDTYYILAMRSHPK